MKIFAIIFFAAVLSLTSFVQARANIAIASILENLVTTQGEKLQCAIEQESFICTDTNSAPVSGTVHSTYPNGKLKNALNLKEGKADGVGKIYYPNLMVN